MDPVVALSQCPVPGVVSRRRVGGRFASAQRPRGGLEHCWHGMTATGRALRSVHGEQTPLTECD